MPNIAEQSESAINRANNRQTIPTIRNIHQNFVPV